MSYDVFGVGGALVDIQVQVTDDILTSLGFAKGIMTLVEAPTQQHVLSTLDGWPVNRCAGGSAANTIMGIADLGGKAAYAGKVGNDHLGAFCLEDMRQLGVTIEVPPSDAGPTGTCVVLITEDAQRTLLTHLGVSATLSPTDIHEADIREAAYVYIEGYLFAGPSTQAAALKAIELAKKNNVRVALTISDPFLVDLCRDTFWALIKGPVDLLFCNLEEVRSLTGKTDPVDCAHDIHQHAANVALTLGGDGSIIMHDGKLLPIEGVKVHVIDTTGAGDMYAAGVLYGITNGLSWQKAGHLASHAAARIVSQLGARLPRRFTPEEIQELLGA
jgi:sugar/nucleoside kinase (ribokinase family)